MNSTGQNFLRRLAACLPLLAATLAAQPAPNAERELPGLERDFLLRVWEAADRPLPANLRSITQTRDGYVWLAAYDGVARFDGARAVVYSGRNTPGLPQQMSVTRVHADPSGRLWCAVSGGRLFSLDRAEWREHTAADGWRKMTVESIVTSPAGKVYFSGGTNLLEFSQGRFSEVATPELPRRFRPPFKAIFGADGTMWLGSASHLWRRDENEWRLVFSPLGGGFIQALAPARGSGVWIALGRELRKFSNTNAAPVKILARPVGFTNDRVEILEDSRGNLWAGSANNGLRVWLRDGRAAPATAATGGVQAQVLALFEDRERNVLVGTAGAGLACFKPRVFETHLGRLGGLEGVTVNTFCEEASGIMLAGTEGGLFRLGVTNTQLRFQFQGIGSRLRQRVTALVKLKAGPVLAAVADKGLFRVEGDTAVALPSDAVDGVTARALFEDSKGRLWIGHERGLVVWATNGPAHHFTSAGRTPPATVRGIAEGWDGAIWFIGREGLLRFKNEKLELVDLPENLPRASLSSLRADADGALWIGVEGRGLLRFKESQAKMFTPSHGLPFASVGATLEEGDFLWLAGDKGLARVSRKSLNAVAESRASRLELLGFNRADGLPSDTFRRGFQPAGYKSADGRLWFASHKGAVSVRPQEVFTALYEPPAIIEEVWTETRPLRLPSVGQLEMEVPAGTRQIHVRCASPSLGKPENARLQYRLESSGGPWRDNGGERVIRLFDLPAGSHRLQVRAYGTDGRLAETPASLRLRLQPLYWQAAWFRSLAIAGSAAVVGLGVWGVMYWRLRQQRRTIREQGTRAQLEGEMQQSQKMEAIGRLAGGIAHDFNNLLTVIIGNAELLRMRLTGKADSQETIAAILQAGGRARDLVAQILTFSRQRLTEPVATDIAPALREACQLLRAGTPAMIEMKFEIPEVLPPIMADRAQVQRVVLNLGTNAVQAVGPSGGRIVMRAAAFHADEQFAKASSKVPQGRYVRITVEDNGHGMDQQTMSRIFDPFFTTKDVGKGTGLGLSVVHGIVEAHGGVITVRSQPGAGTAFDAYFPVTQAQMEVKTETLQPLPKGRGETILLVDDDPAVLHIARTMLEKLNYRVESQPDPQAALKIFTEAPQRFNLVITDYAMPGLDGVELSRKIWSARAGTPVILYSGYGGRFTPGDAEKLGFAHMLEKPFQPRDLAEAVAAALHKANGKS